jgi:hypothetical protein
VGCSSWVGSTHVRRETCCPIVGRSRVRATSGSTGDSRPGRNPPLTGSTHVCLVLFGVGIAGLASVLTPGGSRPGQPGAPFLLAGSTHVCRRGLTRRQSGIAAVALVVESSEGSRPGPAFGTRRLVGSTHVRLNLTSPGIAVFARNCVPGTRPGQHWTTIYALVGSTHIHSQVRRGAAPLRARRPHRRRPALARSRRAARAHPIVENRSRRPRRHRRAALRRTPRHLPALCLAALDPPPNGQPTGPAIVDARGVHHPVLGRLDPPVPTQPPGRARDGPAGRAVHARSPDTCGMRGR